MSHSKNHNASKAPQKEVFDMTLKSVDIQPENELVIDVAPSLTNERIEDDSKNDESNYDTIRGEGSINEMNELKPILLEESKSPPEEEPKTL